MERLTEEQLQQIVDAGREAHELLKNQTFVSVTNELAAQCVNAIVMSHPKEVKAREDYYHQHVALQSIIGLLRAREAQAIQVLQELEADRAEQNLPSVPLQADDE